MITHATIVPGIGGTTIGSERAFGNKPEYLISYPDFKNRDSHLLNYYNNKIDYRVIGRDSLDDLPKVDVFSSTCPCAGLTSLSNHSHANSLHNDWMINSADLVIEKFKPTVFWGENGPRLTSDFGRPVVDRMREVAKRHNYSLSIYETFAFDHNIPQVRKRAFYFFWKDGKVPIMPFTKERNYKRIEDVILDAKSDDSDKMWNFYRRKTKPSEDPYYRYILEEIHNGMSHKDFVNESSHTVNTFKYIEALGYTYDDLAKWMTIKGYPERQINTALKKHNKLANGLNITRKGVVTPKNYVAAFVGPLTWNLTHPVEDRYINLREALSIMGFPREMEILDPKYNYKDLTKSVPVNVAADIASFIKMHLNGKLQVNNTNFLIQDNRNKVFKETTNTLDSFMI